MYVNFFKCKLTYPDCKNHICSFWTCPYKMSCSICKNKDVFFTFSNCYYCDICSEKEKQED